MTDTDQAQQEKKEAMKRLRQERKDSIQRAAALVKSQKKDLKLIREQLEGEGATAPEVAEALTMDVARVIWYMATLKQYGEIVEGSKESGYFKYKRVVKETEGAAG
jgi:predicted transcriptional regulator